MELIVPTRLLATVVLALALTACAAASGVAALGVSVRCEDLPWDMCAFAVSSEGWRCILEKSVLHHARSSSSSSTQDQLQCQTSTVSAVEFAEWVEMEECVQWCGVDRMSLGMSSDALLEKGVATAICSPDCHDNCPNIVDIFSKMATDEGVSLAGVCQQQSSGRRRRMGEAISFLSSRDSDVVDDAWAPSPAPAALPPSSF